MQTGEGKGERDFLPDKAIKGSLLSFDTIKKTCDFEKLRKKGKVSKNKYLITYILPRETERSLRAGFSIGKKTGKAFQRNKTRRRLKEILRRVSIPYAIDVFIIAKHNVNGASYSELKEELNNSLKKFFLNT